MKRPKLLYAGSLDVAPTYGGPIQFYRHFVERQDFEFHKVIERPPTGLGYLASGINFLDRITTRASRSRLFRYFVALHEWLGIKQSIPEILRAAESFQPDAIVTVAHGCFGFAAADVARQLDVPLITFFYDWWPDLGALESRAGVAVFDWQMRRLYRRSDLAFCVCDGMKAMLGDHPNSPILFPIPASRNGAIAKEAAGKRPRVVYLGSMTRGYGRMVSALCRAYAAHTNPSWELAVYGEIRDWSAEAIAQATDSGIYRGARFGPEAASELESADIFLVVMDFEAETRRRVTTSFPSKLLDYCAYGKPIVVWAPEYSSIARFANQTDFALLHTVNDPARLIEKIGSLVAEGSRMSGLAARAANLGATVFQPDTIQRQLVSEIRSVLKT